MGGNAFNAVLSASSFPRLPPGVYEALKARLLLRLQEFYSFVAVPAEAPEKTSHGDVDFVVACPKTNHEENTTNVMNVPHNIIREAIGAQYANTMEGNRTSNFAVPVAQGEWSLFNHTQDEEDARQAADGQELFYQVDINVCADKNEWDRIVFFHSYGDLGMMLGLVARNAGLALGEKGLKCIDSPNPSLNLSESFDQIMEFMGLSMNIWAVGFRTKREIFEWVGTSRFFNPNTFKSEGEGSKRVKPERKMYAEFVQWIMEGRADAAGDAGALNIKRSEWRLAARDEALVFFHQKETFDAMARERDQRSLLKQVFSGSKVRDLAGLGEYWKGVKMIMDEIRHRVGGDEGVLKVYEQEGEEGVKRLVLLAKEDLSLGRAE